MNRTSVITLFVSVVLFTTTAFSASLDKIQFIKISPQDAKAVIKTADGKLQVIKPGDVVAEGVTVKEIAARRIVLEEQTGNGPETLIIRMDGGKTRIERLHRQPDKSPTMVVPVGSAK